MRCWSKYMGRLAEGEKRYNPAAILFSEPAGYAPKGAPWPNIRRSALRPKPSSSGGRRHSGPQKVSRLWRITVAAGHAVRAKTARLKELPIGQRGGRQEGQDQARHKIEIAPNLILNAPIRDFEAENAASRTSSSRPARMSLSTTFRAASPLPFGGSFNSHDHRACEAADRMTRLAYR